MLREQIYNLMNDVTEEILGESGLVLEDLSNIVDIGTQVFSNTDVDNYVKSLVNHIGKMIFVSRKYSGGAPSVLMDSWEYGSVVEKVDVELPEATENETWDLQDGQSYDTNVFYKPTVSAKFFNKRVTFEVPCSFTERQVKESLSSATQLNSFLSMLYNACEKSMTIKTDALIMRTINSLTAETLYDEYGADAFNSKSGVKAVNLLYLYNNKFNESLTVDDCLYSTDFIKFATYTMGVVASRLAKVSTLYNIGGKDKFTPSDMLHFVLLSDFKKSADVYLQSDTFHDEFTKLPNGEGVPYWQGTGTGYSFADVSKIHVKTAGNHTVECGGILGVMFDRDALGVSCLDKRVTSHYNPKAEFFTNWYKFDAGYFNDLNENFVVFFVA